MRYPLKVLLVTFFLIIGCTMVIDELLEYPTVPFGTSIQETLAKLETNDLKGILTAPVIKEDGGPEYIFTYTKKIAGNPCVCSYIFVSNTFVALELHYGFNVESEKAANIVYTMDGDVKKFPLTDIKSLAELYHSISVAFEHKYDVLASQPVKKPYPLSITNTFADKKGLFHVVMMYYYCDVTAWLKISYYETAYLKRIMGE